jgi:hypothetical protein
MALDPLHDVVERRIQEALEAGAFANLAGAGKPLELEDLTRVPEDLRAGYLVLKSAGVLPEELELRQSLLKLDDLLAACDAEPDRERLARERAIAALRLAMLREGRGFGPAHQEYSDPLLRRLERPT